MSSSPATTTMNTSSDVSPQQIGKAFVVQYYRLLHEHPESLHRFYSSSSIFMHDDPNKTVSGIENIAKRIEELSLKQRHVKIRQVDCHSTVSSSVVVQVCGEISLSSSSSSSMMKRFVQTFVLAPTVNAKQKYYVHNDIFRYQDGKTDDNNTKITKDTHEEASFGTVSPKTPSTPSSTMKIEFSDNTQLATPVHQQEKEQPTKPKSYRDAIGKKEKVVTTDNQPSSTIASASDTGSKPAKSGKQKAPKSASRNVQAPRGHPQDVNNYYDDSWYNGTGEEGYLHTGYTDDQEVFVGNLSAQVTEAQIHQLFRPYGHLLLVRIGNTGSQVGAANFAFVVCQSIEMAKAVIADHDSLLTNQQVNVEAKKRRPFSHTFRPTYPTAASPSNYQSTGYPTSFHHHSASAPFYDGGVRGRGARRGGKDGTH